MRKIKQLFFLSYVLLIARIAIFILTAMLEATMGLSAPMPPRVLDIIFPLIDVLFSGTIFIATSIATYRLFKTPNIKIWYRILAIILAIPPLFIGAVVTSGAAFSTIDAVQEYIRRDSWTPPNYDMLIIQN